MYVRPSKVHRRVYRHTALGVWSQLGWEIQPPPTVAAPDLFVNYQSCSFNRISLYNRSNLIIDSSLRGIPGSPPCYLNM